MISNSLAYLLADGEHSDDKKLEQAFCAMQEVAGQAKIKFGEFPSEMRPEYITPELAHLLDRYSDAAYLAIGAQSGSEQMLEAMHREHDVAAVEHAVSTLANYCPKLKKIYVDFIAGLPGETPEDEALSQQLMERLTRISPKVCIYSHTFMPLPGTPMQFMPPGSVGKTTRATFENSRSVVRSGESGKSRKRSLPRSRPSVVNCAVKLPPSRNVVSDEHTRSHRDRSRKRV